MNWVALLLYDGVTCYVLSELFLASSEISAALPLFERRKRAFLLSISAASPLFGGKSLRLTQEMDAHHCAYFASIKVDWNLGP